MANAKSKRTVERLRRIRRVATIQLFRGDLLQLRLIANIYRRVDPGQPRTVIDNGGGGTYVPPIANFAGYGPHEKKKAPACKVFRKVELWGQMAAAPPPHDER